MGYSNLAKGKTALEHHSNPRTAKICKFTPHHMAGNMGAKACAEFHASPSREASANYYIGTDGTIWAGVDETCRAWTSSSYPNDNQAITVEVANISTGGQWPVSEAAWQSLINLAVDVCRRYGFRLNWTGNANGSLTTHDMFAATNCPGPYLKSRMADLAKQVNARLDGQNTAPAAATTANKALYRVRKTWADSKSQVGAYAVLDNAKKACPKGYSVFDTNGKAVYTNGTIAATTAKKSNAEIAQEVLAGKWGNGADRQNRLQAAGYDYNAVQAEVNKAAAGGTPTPTKSIDAVAREVLAGKWGNGNDRINRLKAAGYNATLVQQRVNQLLGY